MPIKNNEKEVLGLFADCILPTMTIHHFGGSHSEVPDLLVVDHDDPELSSLDKIEKAHYIVSGQRLYLYDQGVDPWNMKSAMEKLGIRIDTVKDRKVDISKRAAGAVRKDTIGGPLGFNDYRHVNMAVRFWVEYPEDSFLDLGDMDHLDAIFNSAHRLKKQFGFTPHITLDAKMNDKAQCSGPNLRVVIGEDGVPRVAGGSAKEEWTDHIMTFIGDKIVDYMGALKITDSHFKVVSDEKLSIKPGEVKESDYNALSFNYTIPTGDLNLTLNTFSKKVNLPMEKILNDRP